MKRWARGTRSRRAIGGGCALGVGIFWSCSVAVAQIQLPDGFSASFQTEYARASGSGSVSGESESIFENWLDVDYTRGDFLAGLRYVAFQPPDPTIFPPDGSNDADGSHGVDLYYGEYTRDRFSLRGGNFYSLFGRGLALRTYEDRSLRVDTNALGATGTYYLNDGEVTALIGKTVSGNAEDADRERSNVLAAVDAEHGLYEPAALRVGASLVTTDAGAGGGTREEPVRLKGARASAQLAGVDLVTEFARVDGPNVFAGSVRRGFDGPNYHGRGIYGSASTALGSVGLLFEYKDYDALVFQNNAGIDHIVPPSTLRDHTFNLLNRHPHQLDTADERGFQVEATWVAHDLVAHGNTALLANYSNTRNHDHEAHGNLFDDAYFEVQQEFERATVIAGLSYQRSHASPDTPDPLRQLWTPVADVRYVLNDVHSFHAQFEHQHESSDFVGEFDVNFIVLEWSKSPDLTVGLLVEQTNKSPLQLERLVESDTAYFAGTLDYNLFGSHDLRFFYGTRNAGFVCVGGVCRFEPAFDGFEMALISRF